MLTNATVGYCLSAAAISVASSLLVVAKDTTPPLKGWMASLFGHHWTTHGVFVLAGFWILGYALSKVDWTGKITDERLSGYVLWSAIVGSVILTVFYLSHW